MFSKFRSAVIFISVFLSGTVFLFYVSCRKIDQAVAENLPPQEEHANPEAKFFAEHPPQHPIVTAIHGWVKRHNDEKPFIKTFIERAGYPRWDKAKVIPRPAMMLETEDSATAYDYAYIPFVQESEDKVNSIMVVRVSDTDTTNAFVMDWQYKDYGFGHDSPNWSGEGIFMLFVNFDHDVFGHEYFLLTDSLLFADVYPAAGPEIKQDAPWIGQYPRGRPVRLVVPQEDAPVSECAGPIAGYLTIYSPSGNCNCGGSGGCRDWQDGCDPCATVTYVPVCAPLSECRGITIECGGGGGAPPPLPPGEGGGGGGGGGGSGGGNNPEPPPPCEVDCDGGWLPTLPPPNKTPCDIAHSAAKNMDSVYIKSKADSVLATIPNLATDTNENGFRIFKTYIITSIDPPQIEITGYVTEAVTPGTPSGTNFPTSVPSMHISAAKLHTHPPGGRSAPSAKDIYALIEYRVDNSYYEGDFVAAADGNKYAFTVTNFAQASAFLNTQNGYLSGADWGSTSVIGKAFYEALRYFMNLYKNNSNRSELAYEMSMAAVLKEFNSGVTLHKKDTNGNFKPLIITTTTPNPNKPKKKVYTQDCL